MTEHRENMSAWPELCYEQDHKTFETLHLWTQMVGKVRLARSPWVNHGWHVPLYLSAGGLTTSLISHPSASFDMEFDFANSRLALRTSAGATGSLALRSGSIASFHAELLEMLQTCGVATRIHGAPNEIPVAIPFAEDVAHRPYDPIAARRLWQALLRIDAVFQQFRTAFLGKSSPVHFFWGSFDLAVTRFSGAPAPEHPGGVPNLPDDVVREAYSHEVSSAGFWPGGPTAPYPIFYSYAYPEPPGFREARDLPDGARFDPDLGEYVMPYDLVRNAARPERLLLDFVQATYAAAADAGRWDRDSLECNPGTPGVVRDYRP